MFENGFKIPDIKQKNTNANKIIRIKDNGDIEYDVALDTTFHTKAALDIYQNHPEHLAIVSFVKKVVTERRAVDFEF